jgi:hypothetical protein
MIFLPCLFSIYSLECDITNEKLSFPTRHKLLAPSRKLSNDDDDDDDDNNEEVQKLDRKTRKMLTIHGQHHPKADIDRLYVPRKDREEDR